MKQLLPVIAGACIAFLCGCESTVTYTDNGKVPLDTNTVTVKGTNLPADPGEAGKSTVLGIDSNNDGIRDDVERSIYFAFKTSEQRASEMTVAYIWESEFRAFVKDSLVSDSVLVNHAQLYCAALKYQELSGADTLYYDYNSLIYNTEERMAVHRRLDARHAGLFILLPDDDDTSIVNPVSRLYEGFLAREKQR